MDVAERDLRLLELQRDPSLDERPRARLQQLEDRVDDPAVDELGGLVLEGDEVERVPAVKPLIVARVAEPEARKAAGADRLGIVLR